MKKIVALGALLILAACGKNGSPVVPGSGFPHAYPDPKLSPADAVKAPAPEDQPALQGDAGKAKFSSKGSYIDPAVRSTELQRSAVAPGSTLPYTQTSTPGGNSPLSQTLGTPTSSPLGSFPGATPSDDGQPPQ